MQQVPVWVLVEKVGLETLITLEGSCRFVNYLPVAMEVALGPDLKGQEGTIVRLEGARDGLKMGEASQGASASVLLDDSGGSMAVQLCLSGSSEGARLFVSTLQEALELTWEDYDRPDAEDSLLPPLTSTVLGSCPGPIAREAIWFYVRSSRPIMRAPSRDVAGTAPWRPAWLLVEIWPVCYLLSTVGPLNWRVAGGERVSSLEDQSLDEEDGSTNGPPSGAEVSKARRALREKLQKISWSRLQSTRDPPSSPRAITRQDSASAGDWAALECQQDELKALVGVDPRRGLMINVEGLEGARHEQSLDLLVPSKALLDYKRHAGGPLLLGSANVEGPNFTPLAYCQRLPSAIGPSLVVGVCGSVVAHNECPFALSLALLAPQQEVAGEADAPNGQVLLRGESIEQAPSVQATTGDSWGFEELCVMDLSPGVRGAVLDWSPQEPATSYMEESLPHVSVGVTIEQGSTGEVQIRNARREGQLDGPSLGGAGALGGWGGQGGRPIDGGPAQGETPAEGGGGGDTPPIASVRGSKRLLGQSADGPSPLD